MTNHTQGLREALGWPQGDFGVHDPDPNDDHSAIYLICPGGLMVNTSGDPTPGLDAKRTAWMAENLNAALALPSPRSREEAETGTDGLLPCPFCGAAAERIDIEDGENAGGSCISCTVCQASSNVEFEFKENFVSNWNRRAIVREGDEADREMIEEISATLSYIAETHRLIIEGRKMSRLGALYSRIVDGHHRLVATMNALPRLLALAERNLGGDGEDQVPAEK